MTESHDAAAIARRTAPGSGRGSRPGCPRAARSTARSTSSSVTSRSIRPRRHEPVVEALVGPHVGVLQVDQLEPRRRPSPGRRGRGSPRADRSLATQSSSRAQRIGSSARAGPAPTPSAPARPRSGRRRRCRAGPRRTCGPARSTPSAAGPRSACGRRAACSRCVSVGSWETACSARPARRRRGRRASEPVLDHREHQRGRADLEVGRRSRARFASPMMTCSRRYFSGSACGSSRVLMMGRLSVVSRPTSTSKKSARWLIWKPASRPSWPMPTRPAPETTWRLTKNGVRCRTMSRERRRPAPSGSSRACRRTRPCCRCCSCRGAIGVRPGHAAAPGGRPRP